MSLFCTVSTDSSSKGKVGNSGQTIEISIFHPYSHLCSHPHSHPFRQSLQPSLRCGISCRIFCGHLPSTADGSPTSPRGKASRSPRLSWRSSRRTYLHSIDSDVRRSSCTPRHDDARSTTVTRYVPPARVNTALMRAPLCENDFSGVSSSVSRGQWPVLWTWPPTTRKSALRSRSRSQSPSRGTARRRIATDNTRRRVTRHIRWSRRLSSPGGRA